MPNLSKLILTFTLISFCIPKTFGYEFSTQKQEQLNQIKQYLNQDIQNRDLDWYQSKLDRINQAISNYQNYDVNLKFLIQIRIEIENVIFKNFNSNIIDDTSVVEFNNYKVENQDLEFKTNFYAKYSKDLVGKDIDPKCLKYFDFVDEIAKKNDFPTELIISTWKMEGGCHLRNPANGRGPFQITSNYYTPGEISLEQFSYEIKDFIEFSKAKWVKYEKNPKLREKFGDVDINITYNHYNLDDLRIHSALYNGLTSKPDYLTDSLFINGNFNSDLKSQRDGIVTMFIKLLGYRLSENK